MHAWDAGLDLLPILFVPVTLPHRVNQTLYLPLCVGEHADLNCPVWELTDDYSYL
jgi:hypothetical protein